MDHPNKAIPPHIKARLKARSPARDAPEEEVCVPDAAVVTPTVSPTGPTAGSPLTAVVPRASSSHATNGSLNDGSPADGNGGVLTIPREAMSGSSSILKAQLERLVTDHVITKQTEVMTPTKMAMEQTVIDPQNDRESIQARVIYLQAENARLRSIVKEKNASDVGRHEDALKCLEYNESQSGISSSGESISTETDQKLKMIVAILNAQDEALRQATAKLAKDEQFTHDIVEMMAKHMQSCAEQRATHDQLLGGIVARLERQEQRSDALAATLEETAKALAKQSQHSDKTDARLRMDIAAVHEDVLDHTPNILIEMRRGGK